MKLLSIISIFIVFVSVSEQKNPGKKGGTIVGIDLGTTYSCVGVFKGGQVEIIANEQGNRITPSYVAFTNDGKRLIGDAAKNQLTTNPENTVFDAKRLIGREWNDSSVQKDIKLYPFKVTNKEDKPYVVVNVGKETKEFAPEEISAMILGKMKEIAEAYLGHEVKNAIVTVPAYFNDGQRQATKDAGTIAGLNVVRMINEPTAAAIAYGLDKKDVDMNILVYDLGGGTFDVTLLTIEHGIFEVLATNGDTHLGGEDFDQRVMEHFIKMYKKKTGKDVRKNHQSVQKLRREVEKAKRVLSTQLQTRIEIEAFYKNEDFSETLSRAKFEELNVDLFRATLKPVQQVLEDAGMEKEDIDEIVLAGGSTRIPKVQQLLKDFFNGRELHQKINPDEAIAVGAAVHAGIVAGEEDTGSLVLLDVNPLTLGIEILGGYRASLIGRNTPIPTKIAKNFTTVYDNQVVVSIQVYEGEHEMAEDNHYLGGFMLTGIRPAPKNVPQIEVTFEIDHSGILHVTAQDIASGSKDEITISNDHNRLSQEDIDRMSKSASQLSDQDKKAKNKADVRNELESFLYSTKKLIEDNKEKAVEAMSESEVDTLKKAVEKELKWLEKHRDVPEVKLKERLGKVKDAFKSSVSKIQQKLGESASLGGRKDVDGGDDSEDEEEEVTDDDDNEDQKASDSKETEKGPEEKEKSSDSKQKEKRAAEEEKSADSKTEKRAEEEKSADSKTEKRAEEEKSADSKTEKRAKEKEKSANSKTEKRRPEEKEKSADSKQTGKRSEEKEKEKESKKEEGKRSEEKESKKEDDEDEDDDEEDGDDDDEKHTEL